MTAAYRDKAPPVVSEEPEYFADLQSWIISQQATLSKTSRRTNDGGTSA
jgi:hypothetical protein